MKRINTKMYTALGNNANCTHTTYVTGITYGSELSCTKVIMKNVTEIKISKEVNNFTKDTNLDNTCDFFKLEVFSKNDYIGVSVDVKSYRDTGRRIYIEGEGDIAFVIKKSKYAGINHL